MYDLTLTRKLIKKVDMRHELPRQQGFHERSYIKIGEERIYEYDLIYKDQLYKFYAEINTATSEFMGRDHYHDIDTRKPVISNNLNDFHFNKNLFGRYVMLKNEPIETVDVEQLLNKNWTNGPLALADLEDEFQMRVACAVCDKCFDVMETEILESPRYKELCELDFLSQTEVRGCGHNAAFVIAAVENMSDQANKPKLSTNELKAQCKNLKEYDVHRLINIPCLKERHKESWDLIFRDIRDNAKKYRKECGDEIRKTSLYKDLYDMYFYGIPEIKNVMWMKGDIYTEQKFSHNGSDTIAMIICSYKKFYEEMPEVRCAMENLEIYNQCKDNYNLNIRKELAEIDTEKLSKKEIEQTVNDIISKAEKHPYFLNKEMSELFEEMKEEIDGIQREKDECIIGEKEELEIGNR